MYAAWLILKAVVFGFHYLLMIAFFGLLLQSVFAKRRVDPVSRLRARQPMAGRELVWTLIGFTVYVLVVFSYIWLDSLVANGQIVR